MTYEEYRAFDAAAETKHEYVNGEVYAMAGGTPEHARLQTRVSRLLGNALEGKPCEVYSSDLRVRITATGRSTYPDVTVVCGQLATASDDPHGVTNPRVLIEVLSESTEGDDRGSKWSHYQRIESLEEFVLVSQDQARVEVYRRSGEIWTYRSITSGSVELESLGVAIALDELYESALGG